MSKSATRATPDEFSPEDQLGGLPLFSDPTTVQLTAYQQCNPRQRRFVDAMLLFGVGVKAYREAGYKAKTDAAAYQGAYELLQVPLVAAAKREREQLAAVALGVNVVNVLREMLVCGTSDVGHYEFSVGPQPVKLASGAPPDAMRAVQSIKRKVTRTPSFGRDEDGNRLPPTVEVTVEVKLHPKVPALTELAKRVDLFAAALAGGPQQLPQVIAMEDPTLEPPPEADESGLAGTEATP